jgi:hypothetical protein
MALASGASGGNGVFAYGNGGVMPSDSFEDSNYYVDVMFTPFGEPHGATIFGNAVPVTPLVDDPNPVEVGVKFQSRVSGSISAIRFYRGDFATATFTVNLYNVDPTCSCGAGALIGTATLSPPSEAGRWSPGWLIASFPKPVLINANTTYIASYYSPVGNYADDQRGLTNAVSNQFLSALASSASGGNGVFSYGTNGVIPASSYNDSNYYVDVVFNEVP